MERKGTSGACGTLGSADTSGARSPGPFGRAPAPPNLAALLILCLRQFLTFDFATFKNFGGSSGGSLNRGKAQLQTAQCSVQPKNDSAGRHHAPVACSACSSCTQHALTLDHTIIIHAVQHANRTVTQRQNKYCRALPQSRARHAEVTDNIHSQSHHARGAACHKSSSTGIGNALPNMSTLKDDIVRDQSCMNRHKQT